MGMDYDPTQCIAGVDTDKILMARKFVRIMRGTRGIAYDSEARTLVELAEALERLGRVEEGSKARELAGPLIDDALAPVYRTVAEIEGSGDLPAQCFALLALAEALACVDRTQQAEAAFASVEEIGEEIYTVVRKTRYEVAELHSWVAGVYSLNVLRDVLAGAGREEAADRLFDRCNGFGRNMPDAAIELGLAEVGRARAVRNLDREGQAMALLARALHEAGRRQESAYCAAEALRLGHGNYRKIERLTGGQAHWGWSSTAEPGSNDPTVYRSRDPSHSSTPRRNGRVKGPLSPTGSYAGDLIVGYLAIKALGPFLEAFATKLGEQFGESTGRAISRLALRRRPRRRDQVEIESSEAKTTVILPHPFTDDAKEAFIDIDVADPDILGMTLYWDEAHGEFLPTGASGPDSSQQRFHGLLRLFRFHRR
ncbi:hypothetical protein NMG29_39265 [Streptomyces cocklensis]|uniref:Uncharacterized protein n=1 Tax=Actinacidiphila cocklensis TaxID=887465 RepID=A0A9W4E189_9ACTN|nr:hypothetical protein [Actinacidiphila cocklensis]MDD1064122.1 hypothetical protein [Actinacidiphila cocklensis]CAG6397596.1 hypothetical protein SCOCK_580022 [Actinacidiphila cocklensis]